MTTSLQSLYAIARFASEDAAFQALTTNLPHDLAAEYDDEYQDGVLVYQIANWIKEEMAANPDRFAGYELPSVNVLIPKEGDRVAVYNPATDRFIHEDLSEDEYVAFFAATYDGPYQFPEIGARQA